MVIRSAFVDPEGDYSELSMLVTLGEEHAPPSIVEAQQLLYRSDISIRLNLVAVPFSIRPAFLNDFYERTYRFRERTGRPQFLIIDEAHHLFPARSDQDSTPISRLPAQGLIMATVHPSFIARPVLNMIDSVIALGTAPAETLAGFARVTERSQPETLPNETGETHALLWDVRTGESPEWLVLDPCQSHHVRHRRKYAAGDVGILRSFYFRGPDNHLNVRAENLIRFMELADVVDDRTWDFHLRRGDYEKWVRNVIRDEECANSIRRIQSDFALSPRETRQRIVDVICDRYTLPA
jgi:hypothetical protein